MNAPLIDAAGRRHQPEPRARIVSLVPSLTELLFDLDLAGQVVGRTTFCIHPSPAVDAVESWKFEPALRQGEAVASTQRLRLRFAL